MTLASRESVRTEAIVADSAGIVTVAGTVLNGSTLNRDYLTARYNSTGQELWRHRFDGKGVTSAGDNVTGLLLDDRTSAVSVVGTSNSPTISS